MTTQTITLTPAQARLLAPLRCQAREAAGDHRPGLVLGQVWFHRDGSVQLAAGFVGHEAGKQLIQTLSAE